MNVHIFLGAFESLAHALPYTEAQWEPEPPAEASDESYRVWEERNPTWAMRSELGIAHLDADFIETIGRAEGNAYLSEHLAHSTDLDLIRAHTPPDANVLVVIFEEALGGFECKLSSTARLSYCGRYDWKP
jgi:hypothetical protein